MLLQDVDHYDLDCEGGYDHQVRKTMTSSANEVSTANVEESNALAALQVKQLKTPAGAKAHTGRIANSFALDA